MSLSPSRFVAPRFPGARIGDCRLRSQSPPQSARMSGSLPSADAAASSMIIRASQSSACPMGSNSVSQTWSKAVLKEVQAGLSGLGIRISRRCANCHVGYVNVCARRLSSINRTGVEFHQAASDSLVVRTPPHNTVFGSAVRFSLLGHRADRGRHGMGER